VRSLRLLLTSLLLLPALASPAAAITVAGFGDSLTHGHDYLNYLPSDMTTLDFGLTGEESWDGVDRLPGVLDTLVADVVIIMEGTNDVRDGSYTNELSLSSLTSMVDMTLDAGFAVVLMAPPIIVDPADPVYDERLAYLSGALEWVAADRGVPFVDLYDIFSGLADPTPYFQEDGVHAADPGRMLIASSVEPAIRIAVIPEPSTALLLALGLTVLAASRHQHSASGRGR
jgi:lysophospholipase L1-like esterase